MMRWVRVKELIVPVLKGGNSLEKMVSYHIFKEGEIDMETLIARLEPLTKGEKVAVHRYVRRLAWVGFVELEKDGDAEVIKALFPPIHVDTFKHALARKLELYSKRELARELGVSPHAIDTWKRGTVPRNPRVFAKLMEV